MYDINNLTKDQLRYFKKRFKRVTSVKINNNKILIITLADHTRIMVRLNDRNMVYLTNYYSKTFKKLGMKSNSLAQAIEAGLTTDIIQNG